ncbi:MAG TPA: carboxypeptidase regulatory-like domain-containing protein, partial [Longimicrobiales bacterium]|nr:carboxypeptidase regulatory-like domain-containing protein [Longimicrobiales bacterium]
QATLQGSVNPNGATTSAWFEWATDPSLDGIVFTDPVAVGSGTADVIVSEVLVDLQPETAYYYRVAATNAAGTSRGSIVGFRTSLPAPTNLIVDQAGTFNVLVWVDNSTTETSFRIERSTTSSTSGFSTIGSVNADITFFYDLPPLPVGTVYYRVRACNAEGCSATSNVVSVIVPAPVISGTVTACSASCFPLMGFQVTLTGPSNRTTTTNANGQYQFTDMPSGTYTVSVQDLPCDPATIFDPSSRVVTVSGGGDVDTANFQGSIVVCAPGRGSGSATSPAGGR